MTDQGSTHTDISDAGGPIHTGSGNQINEIYHMSFVEAQHRRTRTGLWSTTHLDWLEQRFVEPSGFERASAALDERNAILLRGMPGSGRRTAALMLLRRQTLKRSPAARFRELFPARVDGDPEWDAEDLIESNDRLLLDLTSVDDDTAGVVEKGLMEFRGVVETRGAFLVIISDLETRLGNGAADLGCPLAPPSRAKALVRHLEVDGITDPLGVLLPQPDRLARLESWPLREIERLVTLTHAAQDSQPAGGARRWLERAFNALTDTGTSIADRVSGLESAPLRALLFSAAMLNGKTADITAGATDDLLHVLGYPTTLGAVLDSPNLAEGLEAVGARIDEGRRVRFKELAEDAAVLGYFWDAFPDLRPYLTGWIDRVIRHEALTPPERDSIAARYAEQSLRTDRPGDLTAAIELWTDGTPPTQRLKLFRPAMTLLDRGLAHERHGQQFRHQIYTWSKQDPPIRADLAAVLIEACLGQLAESHPEQALVRLHHFARRKGCVGELGLDALARFVEEDDRRLSSLLHRISSLTDRPNPADARIFVRIADPIKLTAERRRSRPLLDDQRTREQLVVGWRLVLSQSPIEHCAELDRWLHAAAAQISNRGVLLDVLVEASTDFGTASRLEAAARVWVAATDNVPARFAPQQLMATAKQLIDELDLRQQSTVQHFM